MTAVKGFNEISYDELMDVNGGIAVSTLVGWLIAVTITAAATQCTASCTDRVVNHIIDDVMGESW